MPVVIASHKLNACERRYSQLDKEGAVSGVWHMQIPQVFGRA